MATAIAVTECSVVRLEKPAMIAVVHDEPEFSALFISYLLTRNIRRAAANHKQRGLGKPGTFDFLGFTFICGKSRAGKFLIRRKSRRDRVRAKLTEIKEELRRRMHGPVREQAEWLKQVVTGFCQYHAVPTNGPALGAFRYHVIEIWRRTLRRRGQRHRMTWRRIGKLADQWLPKPRILHPWPNQRFAVKHPRWEPYAGKPHVRFCAGGSVMCVPTAIRNSQVWNAA
jgi:RNA-directed DNA polymerase